MISTQAIVLAPENNIDTIFMDTYGYPIGRVWLSKKGRTALICRKQPEVMVSPQGFHPVIDMVTQELNNQIATALAVDECAYSRDVAPLSPAVREANRRNQVVTRACPWGSTEKK